MTTSDETPSCPECGSSDVVEIVYGYPGPEMVEASLNGEVELGGCCLSDIQWRCRACEHAFPGPNPPDWLVALQAGG